MSYITSKPNSGNIMAKSALKIAQSSQTLTAVSKDDMMIILQLKSHNFWFDKSNIRFT